MISIFILSTLECQEELVNCKRLDQWGEYRAKVISRLAPYFVCKNFILKNYLKQWNDSRLAWNPEEFGGARKLRYAASEVWKPDVTLYSSKNTENLLNCWESPVVISSSGEVSWIPTCEGTTSCPQMDLIREPYGNHTCSFKIGSWTYDSDDLDIELLVRN